MQCLVDCAYIAIVGYMDRWLGEWVHERMNGRKKKKYSSIIDGGAYGNTLWLSAIWREELLIRDSSQVQKTCFAVKLQVLILSLRVVTLSPKPPSNFVENLE